MWSVVFGFAYHFKLEISLNQRKPASMAMITTEINKQTPSLCISKVVVQYALHPFFQKKKKNVRSQILI